MYHKLKSFRASLSYLRTLCNSFVLRYSTCQVKSRRDVLIVGMWNADQRRSSEALFYTLIILISSGAFELHIGYKFILNSCDRLGFKKSKTLKKCSDQIFNRFSFLCNQPVVRGLFSASSLFQSALWTIVWKDLFEIGNSNAYQSIIRLIPARLASGEVPDIEQTCFLH